MIRDYLHLNKFQQNKLNQFINRNDQNKLSMEEMDIQFKSQDYDFGRGVIVKFDGEDIVGKVLVILKECSVRGVVYIVGLGIDQKVEDKKLVTAELIEEAKNIGKRYGSQEIYLGIRDSKIVEIVESLNLNKQYSAIKMTLDDRKVRCSPLNLIELSEDNKKEYLKIYNDAFKEAPNGATLTAGEVDEYIKTKDENNYFYIAEIDNHRIGFLEFRIKDGIGEFDLGLIKNARGGGYGKQLLETAISFLNSKEV